MKKFTFRDSAIPKELYKDVSLLRNFIITNCRISIGLTDCYKLWREISREHDEEWMDIEYHADGVSRATYLIFKMEQHGDIEISDY